MTSTSGGEKSTPRLRASQGPRMILSRERMHAAAKHNKMLGRVSGVHADEDDKRAGNFPGAVCRGQSAVRQFGKHCALGSGARLQGRADSLMGRPVVRFEAGCGEQGLLRRSVWHVVAARFAFEITVNALARAACSFASRS